MGWLPFMDAGGDKFVVDLDPDDIGKHGQVISCSNYGRFDPSVVATSLRDFLHKLSEQLIEREFSLDTGGHIWLNESFGDN